MFAGFISLFFMSCEGPAGPAGIDGMDGQDGANGEVTCLVCHAGENIQAVTEQFSQSVHKAGQIAVDYAGGRASCAQCHSSEGFIEFARTDTVAENISVPSAWECKTCHSIHSTFEGTDYALRLADPINFIALPAETADFGNSNLCANCHQTRTAEPNIAKPGATFNITSTHYGPHHGPQANILYGVGFAEIAGSINYPTVGAAKHMEDGAKCVGCHMAPYGNGAGGHTWNPSLDACNDCHGVIDTDFNHGGVQSTTQTQLDQLRDLLIARGVLEYVVADEAYEPITGTHPMILAQAYFNWIGIEEDRSLGVHNPAYVKALLTNTIEAVQALP